MNANMYCYAQYCPYTIDSPSEKDVLVRFETYNAMRYFVKYKNEEMGSGAYAYPVSDNVVASRYDLKDFEDERKSDSIGLKETEEEFPCIHVSETRR